MHFEKNETEIGARPRGLLKRRLSFPAAVTYLVLIMLSVALLCHYADGKALVSAMLVFCLAVSLVSAVEVSGAILAWIIGLTFGFFAGALHLEALFSFGHWEMFPPEVMISVFFTAVGLAASSVVERKWAKRWLGDDCEAGGKRPMGTAARLAKRKIGALTYAFGAIVTAMMVLGIFYGYKHDRVQLYLTSGFAGFVALLARVLTNRRVYVWASGLVSGMFVAVLVAAVARLSPSITPALHYSLKTTWYFIILGLIIGFLAGLAALLHEDIHCLIRRMDDEND